ncbi:MAG: hypothetical protein IPJ17_12615 [Holophagales bacterium]|nr:MAG: hypothetical protein IPJ17_12615 [Holophagales bacterium]
MSLPEDILDLLRRHGERGGFEPWLFAPVGADWRWWSWAEVDAGAARVAKLLENVGFGRGNLVGLPEPVLPGTICALLGAIRAGIRPVASAVCPAKVLEAAGLIASQVRFCLEFVAERRESGPAGERRAADWEAIAATARSGGVRPSMVRSGSPWSDVDLERLGWSIAADAALLFEPAVDAFGASVLWARPTHLAESGAVLTELAARLRALAGGRQPEARLRRRLDRLSRVWWFDAPPVEAASALFAGLGARVERWPFGVAVAPSGRASGS